MCPRWGSWTTRRAITRGCRRSRSRSTVPVASHTRSASRSWQARSPPNPVPRPPRVRPRSPTLSPSPAADVAGVRSRTGEWTCPADVRAAARKKWDSRALLTPFSAGQDSEPFTVPIRGPSARQIGDRLAEVRQWAAEWAQAAGWPLRVEYKQVGGRHFGVNSIPCRARLDGYDEPWALLKAGPDVRRLTELIEAARGSRLIPWGIGHPMRALPLPEGGPKPLGPLCWSEGRPGPGT